ncbi:hypothetical protein [Rhodococcus globerulus]|jgi:hypothetical protein|uniref:hypothetical protein n=1 Tax=Rhodococcus globerulus TaxID=33008 RepID=UPI001C56D9DE|nr:hypothetical protein [Rhodococcus globerulus]QXW04055.1 hypothetical protein KYT97_08550 [Rhodococcus globerulus]
MSTNMQDTPRPPSVITAVAANRRGTIALRATEQGIPIDIRIHHSELRYGGARLATEIMALSARAGMEAGVRHRLELEADGVPADIVNALGLATREQLADAQAAEEHTDTAPTTWMRSI